MGQKISPKLFRAKRRISADNTSGDITDQAKSVWFAHSKDYSSVFFQDSEIRDFLKKRLKGTGLVEIVIKRFFRRIEVTLHTTKPGLVIGKGGALINALKSDLLKKLNLSQDLKLNIEEFRDPNRSAQVIADDISFALQKRVPFRKVCKNYIEQIRYAGVKGAKIVLSGRLNGAEIARKEDFSFGSLPRHTIDAQIDYAEVPCKTFAGIIGIKVFLNKGNKITNYNEK